MATSLLLSPSSLQAKEKKMGNNNKLLVVALFVTKTIEEKKCNGSKLVVNAHFCFK